MSNSNLILALVFSFLLVKPVFIFSVLQKLKLMKTHIDYKLKIEQYRRFIIIYIITSFCLFLCYVFYIIWASSPLAFFYIILFLLFIKSIKLSSGAILFNISFQHLVHLCFIIHHLFFLLSISTGFIIASQVDSLSQGKSLSRCLL